MTDIVKEVGINSVETKKEKQRRKKFRFFDSYIPKLLKQSFENNGITADARQQLNSILIIFTKKIADIALKLTKVAGKRTLSVKEVESAINVFLSGELREHAKSEGNKAVENFLNNLDKKGTSRQSKAEIIFPPSVAEKFLRLFETSLIMVTHTAPVYLAAILEYICMEIIELASEMAKDVRRIRITVADIELSSKGDTELNKLFMENNIKFLGGSVESYIHPSLLVKKQKIKNKVSEKNSKNFGVAIKDIKKYQKMGNTLIFAKQPFEKFVRQIISDYKVHVKISKNVFSIIQYILEDYLVNFLTEANNAALHAGRVKLMVSDIDFVKAYKEGRRPIQKIETTFKFSEKSIKADDSIMKGFTSDDTVFEEPAESPLEPEESPLEPEASPLEPDESPLKPEESINQQKDDSSEAVQLESNNELLIDDQTLECDVSHNIDSILTNEEPCA